MNDMIHRYLYSFFNPKSIQLALKNNREPDNVISLFGDVAPKTQDEKKMSFEESLSVSWFFAFIQTFYSILIIYLGFEFFRQEQEVALLSEQKATTIKIFFTILEIVLFPIGFWFYVKFWSNIIKLFIHLFSFGEEEQERAEDLVIHAMSAHSMLIFPFFGPLFTRFSQLIFIYQGLRLNLGFSLAQSLAVIVFPLFLLFLSGLLSVIFVMMLFSGF